MLDLKKNSRFEKKSQISQILSKKNADSFLKKIPNSKKNLRSHKNSQKKMQIPKKKKDNNLVDSALVIV